MRRIAQLAAWTAALAVQALAANPQGAPDDHFQCYVVTAARPSIPDVQLVDDLEAASFHVVKTVAVCNPTNADGGGIVDSATHLTAYQIRSTGRTPRQRFVRIGNRLGDVLVDTRRADRLLVPSAKDLSTTPPPPGTNNVDHYKCYRAKVSPGQPKFQPVRVAVADQFESKQLDLTRPTRLCAPVDKNGEGIKNPLGHLLCYAVHASATTPPQSPFSPIAGIHVTNQFGSAILKAVREDELCVPSVKNGSCLARPGSTITLSGTYTTQYSNRSLAADAKIDARAATFDASPSNLYPITLGGGSGVCFAGGDVAGQYDRNLTWQQMHDMNNAGIAFENPGLTVEGIRIDNVTDGIRPQDGGSFTIRGVWLTYNRDDCVEDDHLQGGLIDDSLLDGCYVAVSARPGQGSTADGRSELVTIRHSLLRLEPMPGPRGGSATDKGNGQFFKWDDLAPKLALDGNVFLAEQVSQEGAATMGMTDRLVSCSNNVMVWLGGGAYPTPLPSCFTVTADRSVWDHAVSAWHTRHPGVGP